MEDKYEVFYGEDGKWGVWSFIMNFEDMETAHRIAKGMNMNFNRNRSEIEEEGGENDTN